MSEYMNNSEEKNVDIKEHINNSEENNINTTENINNPQNKKRSFTKKIIIFLICFFIVSVVATSGLIYYKNYIEIVTPSKEENVVKPIEHFGMKSLNEKYNVNEIKLSNCFEGFGDYIDEYGQNKIQINYVQISGLKNITVQNKINKKIKSMVESYYSQSDIKNPNIRNVHINAYVTASFSNVLSINIYGWTTYNTEAADTFFEKGLNINLATGEEITFEKMFNSDANIKSILTQSAYEYYAYEYANNEDLTADMEKLDYSEIERKVFLFINKYNNGKLKDFYFTAKNIYLIYNNQISISIDMKDFYEQIAIYNRYKSYSDLYTGEYSKNLKNVPCFVDMRNKYYFELNEISDSAISCITVTENSEYDYIVNSYYEKYIEKVKLEHMEIAKNEKNVLISTEIMSNIYDGFVHINTNTIKYDLKKNMYEKVCDYVIYEELRNMPYFEGPYIIYDAENEYYNKYIYTYMDYEYDEFSGRLLDVTSSGHIYDAVTNEYIEITTEEEV